MYRGRGHGAREGMSIGGERRGGEDNSHYSNIIIINPNDVVT